MSEIAPDTVLKMQIKVIKYIYIYIHIYIQFFGRSQTVVTVTYFAKCLLASFSPCFPIFIQSLKGICIKLREREVIKIRQGKMYTNIGLFLFTLKVCLP